MSELPGRVKRGIRDVDALEEREAGVYAVTTTPFEAVVRVDAAETPTFVVTVTVPTLSAAVEGDVADVVEDGWLETFDRRMEDAGMPLSGDATVDPDVERTGDTVVVEASVTDVDPRRGAENAKALTEYVEGTYMEGVVPGYDYRDPVATLRERARHTE